MYLCRSPLWVRLVSVIVDVPGAPIVEPLLLHEFCPLRTSRGSPSWPRLGASHLPRMGWNSAKKMIRTEYQLELS